VVLLSLYFTFVISLLSIHLYFSPAKLPPAAFSFISSNYFPSLIFFSSVYSLTTLLFSSHLFSHFLYQPLFFLSISHPKLKTPRDQQPFLFYYCEASTYQMNEIFANIYTKDELLLPTFHYLIYIGNESTLFLLNLFS
jgi:hypothetical protein